MDCLPLVLPAEYSCRAVRGCCRCVNSVQPLAGYGLPDFVISGFTTTAYPLRVQPDLQIILLLKWLGLTQSCPNAAFEKVQHGGKDKQIADYVITQAFALLRVRVGSP